MEAVAPSISLSPTFSSHTKTGLAAKVVEELDSREVKGIPAGSKVDADFAFNTKHSVLQFPITADEIFQNGKILPLYPVIVNNKAVSDDSKDRRDVRKLFVTESVVTKHREQSPAASEPEKRQMMRKSFSLGNISKRWKLKGLLQKIQSSGSTGSFIFVGLSFSAKEIEKKVNLAADRLSEGEITAAAVKLMRPAAGRIFR